MHLMSGFLLPLLHLAIFTFAHPKAQHDYSKYVEDELDFLAKLGTRRTGSPTHNQLVDHIQEELEDLGLPTYTDTWYFEYDDTSFNPGKLNIFDEEIQIASAVPYSGHTASEGVSGPLIDLRSGEKTPAWEKAKEGVAVLNITNTASNRTESLPLWPGSTAWKDELSTGVPASVANSVVTNLTAAKEAGVQAIVYVWDNISDELANGQYGPFHNDYFSLPALYVSGRSADAVLTAAKGQNEATIVLEGKLVPNTATRNIWTVIPGIENPEESVIINTHTDGTNIIEENGHIALLAYARELVRKRPKKTTILAFITAHIHSAPFTNTKRATSRWLADNPQLWNKSSPDGHEAVFGSCVEHLGAISYTEDIEKNTYTHTDALEDELLYASSSRLAQLTLEHWSGADPNITRVINPSSGEQAGEGMPFLTAGIPEISLVTAPSYLLKEYSRYFDERQLVDVGTTVRQIESFIRIWRGVDSTTKDELKETK